MFHSKVSINQDKDKVVLVLGEDKNLLKFCFYNT